MAGRLEVVLDGDVGDEALKASCFAVVFLMEGVEAGGVVAYIKMNSRVAGRTQYSLTVSTMYYTSDRRVVEKPGYGMAARSHKPLPSLGLLISSPSQNHFKVDSLMECFGTLVIRPSGVRVCGTVGFQSS